MNKSRSGNPKMTSITKNIFTGEKKIMQQSRKKRRWVEKLKTSNGCWFWGPLEMVDMDPLSALNRGQIVDKVMSWLGLVIYKGNSVLSTMCHSLHHSYWPISPSWPHPSTLHPLISHVKWSCCAPNFNCSTLKHH